jgi:hypothetical protein
MSDDGEEAPERNNPVAIAERRVEECEERVLDQLQFIKDLQADGYHEAAKSARKVLALFEDTLATARKHLDRARGRVARP